MDPLPGECSWLRFGSDHQRLFVGVAATADGNRCKHSPTHTVVYTACDRHFVPMWGDDLHRWHPSGSSADELSDADRTLHPGPSRSRAPAICATDRGARCASRNQGQPGTESISGRLAAGEAAGQPQDGLSRRNADPLPTSAPWPLARGKSHRAPAGPRRR